MTANEGTASGTPEAEVEIDEALLRDLLADQMPEFAEQPITLLDTGWDNVSFRLGGTRVVRMPRRDRVASLGAYCLTGIGLDARQRSIIEVRR